VNKKGISTLVIVAIIVIAVVIGGIAVYVLYSGGTTEPTPTPEPTPDIEGATSIQYDADITSQGATIQYKYAGKNLGTDNLMIRIDLLGGEAGNYSYILNAGDETAWAAVNDEWTDVSSDFAAQWAAWGAAWTENLDALKANWSGTGDYTFTAENGDSITIKNVSLNPELADSLFQPPT
jgi:hypothetical protein